MLAVAKNRVDEVPSSNWEARLQLSLQKKHDRTVLDKLRHEGPLRIQRAFYPEAETCHLYILHPPGGVVGGDSLNIDVSCKKNTSTLITTPAANKFYQSNGHTAFQNQNIVVKENATMEWLPQDTILFNTSKVHSNTKIELSNDSKFLGWEIVSFGRPACKEEFTQGLFKQNYELWIGDDPILIDRVSIQNRSEVFNGLWGLQGQPVMGLMTVVNSDVEKLQQAKFLIQKMIDDVRSLSVTVMGNVLVCRCLDTNSMTIRDKFIDIWKTIRQITLDKKPCEPRIWAT